MTTFDGTGETDKSTAAMTIDTAGVVANPLLKRDVLQCTRDPDACDNGDDKDKEEDVACDMFLVRCYRVCLARRGQASEIYM